MALLRVSVVLVVLLVVAGCVKAQYGAYRQYRQAPTVAPVTCANKLDKLYLNQSGYVQYVHYMADIPKMSGFTLHYWFYLQDNQRTATFFNYGLDEAVQNNNLTIQLESGSPQHWRLEINDVLVSRVPSPHVFSRQWYHALHSWDAAQGVWSHFFDGKLVQAGVNQQSRQLVIPGGGIGVSGQHQNTLHNGMDVGQGLEGWLTLLQLSDQPLPYPARSQSASGYLASLSWECSKDVGGDVISWRNTPRKGYGGVMETPGEEQCGFF